MWTLGLDLAAQSDLGEGGMTKLTPRRKRTDEATVAVLLLLSGLVALGVLLYTLWRFIVAG